MHMPGRSLSLFRSGQTLQGAVGCGAGAAGRTGYGCHRGVTVKESISTFAVLHVHPTVAAERRSGAGSPERHVSGAIRASSRRDGRARLSIIRHAPTSRLSPPAFNGRESEWSRSAPPTGWSSAGPFARWCSSPASGCRREALGRLPDRTPAVLERDILVVLRMALHHREECIRLSRRPRIAESREIE